MKEFIKKIEEVKDLSIEEKDYTVAYGGKIQFDGYIVTTNLREIAFLISNEQQCCEDWGYLFSEDNPQEFIGAELLSINPTNIALKTYKLDEDRVYTQDANGDVEWDLPIIFINLETSNGTLQFVAYNSHNGYYGHEVLIRSNRKALPIYFNTTV